MHNECIYIEIFIFFVIKYVSVNCKVYFQCVEVIVAYAKCCFTVSNTQIYNFVISQIFAFVNLHFSI